MPVPRPRRSRWPLASTARSSSSQQPSHPREVHAGLGFTNYGSVSLAAPATGSYWVAVYAADPEATGKYVFAPGVREEFGPDAIGGMADLVSFFIAPLAAGG